MSQQPRPTRIPRSTSTATLSRAPSSATLIPSARLAVNQPLRATGSSIPLPKSRIAAVKSTATLRQPSSHLSLRPPRTVRQALEGKVEPSKPIPTIRRISSTNFKENFFAPPPPIQPAKTVPAPARGEKGTLLVRKRSQLLPQRATAPRRSLLNVAPDSKRDAKPSFGAKQLSLRVVTQRPETRLVQVPPAPSPLTNEAPTPSPLPPTPSPLPSTSFSASSLRKSHRTSLHSSLRPGPLPFHLGASPWNGPRTSIDQIKDTEYSFTEDDSVGNLAIPGIPAFATPGKASVSEVFREKEREIERLKTELSEEREAASRMEREVTERELAGKLGHEVEKAKAERMIAEMRRMRLADRFLAVERAAAEALEEIAAKREVIRQLRAML
ncbi:uncharacterized protein MKK02DRAFT_34153 [Dioszegia hungarica]|uniref:Uncharacterized protein n=1 Tax=Dioszegia hungarica TaxID=4972 RepID=A0AA38HCG9_9TREE|nr:uncharacterized protein MKK02DRAFT_34153 [Dioszegia hungarica]KAI9637114.1 hypothetical protein MKK02DRAFT_34153 [Dioszegia hungarica]